MKLIRALLVLLIVTVAFPAIGQNTPHSVTLSWSADPTATGGFNIYRGTISGGPYTKIGSVPATALTYSDSTGVAGTAYFYVVTGFDTATPLDESGFSNQASATAKGNPQNPAGLGAVSN